MVSIKCKRIRENELPRYYWAIQPRNAVGASCSLFLACTGAVQAYRRWHYDTYVAGTEDDPAGQQE